MTEVEQKEKLVIFPKAMLDILAENKKITGETASSYIRRATATRMVAENLMIIVPEKVAFNQK